MARSIETSRRHAATPPQRNAGNPRPEDRPKHPTMGGQHTKNGFPIMTRSTLLM